MKQLATLSLLILSWLVTGCMKSVTEKTTDIKSEEKINLTIGVLTKSPMLANTDVKTAIENIRIYIYDVNTGILEDVLGGVFDYTNPDYYTKLVYGKKRIITLANMDTFPAESSQNQVNTLIENYQINWNKLLSSGKFPMTDDTTIDFTPNNKNFKIVLKQSMSRICLKKITNNLANGKPIKVVNTYLSNIPGSKELDSTKVGQCNIWYNKYGRTFTAPYFPIESINHSEVKEYGFMSVQSTINNGSQWSPATNQYLYTLPNNTYTDHNGKEPGAFVPRFTRLVITTEVEGERYYYPISLLNLKSGYSYDVNLTIKKLGSDDPDKLDFHSTFDVNIGTEEWFYTADNIANIEF